MTPEEVQDEMIKNNLPEGFYYLLKDPERKIYLDFFRRGDPKAGHVFFMTTTVTRFRKSLKN